jgi:hypothetical protein
VSGEATVQPLRCTVTDWWDECQSTIVYKGHESAQVLYVIQLSSILGRPSLVPVGKTGTIRREQAGFPGAFCDKTKYGCDGCRWWHIKTANMLDNMQNKYEEFAEYAKHMHKNVDNDMQYNMQNNMQNMQNMQNKMYMQNNMQNHTHTK